MSEFEITALVMSEHDAFRRAFADLEQADDPAAAWRGLADRLEVHAVAEEELFYPALAHAGGDGVNESVTAVRQHNDIRHAVRAVDAHDPGGDAWWDAVRTAQAVNAEHMAEEEREFFPDLKSRVDEEQRDNLGLRWLQFHDEHEQAAGLTGDDADPDAVVHADVPQGAPDGA